jgi:replicative DNA helicase
VSSGDIYKKKLSDKDIGLIQSLDENTGAKKLYVDDTVQSLDSVLSSIRYLHYKFGVELFFLDYLQLVTGEDKSEEKQMAKAARSLKNLAKELDISIVAISQLSRETGSKSNHKPTMRRLRGSGQIEEAADNIILIWRPEEDEIDYFDDDGYIPTEGKAYIDFAKGRNIGTTNFIIKFLKEVGLFYEEKSFNDMQADPDAFTESGRSDSDTPF